MDEGHEEAGTSLSISKMTINNVELTGNGTPGLKGVYRGPIGAPGGAWALYYPDFLLRPS